LKQWFGRLARIGVFLAFVVVTLGAWVRLTDAGLGCPDWPGCYGQLVVPGAIIDDPSSSALIDQRPLEQGKAWREMIHRYFASTLGLICLGLAAIAWFNRKDPEQTLAVPFALLGLVVLQGLLGMWTVTLLLKPIIVVAHLFGGFATLALLFWLSRPHVPALAASPRLRALGVAALAALIAQIFLGGWTSANYAALACPDFPSCQTTWWPTVVDFDEAFVLWRGIGIDYEGGVLEHPARVAIHFAHRLGAIVATLLVAGFALGLLRMAAGFHVGVAVLLALVIQLTLGISIIVFGVPLPAAVAHNGVAVLLLLTLINAHQRIWQN
jgi:cytochrome c oxidase assembly protein subunit 15